MLLPGPDWQNWVTHCTGVHWSGHTPRDHVETRGTRASAIVSSSDEDIITGLYVSYNGPHFYCWSGSRAQLKVNRSGLTRDDQAGPSHSSGRSESLTGLGVSRAGHLVPGPGQSEPIRGQTARTLTNQRPASHASIPGVASIRRGARHGHQQIFVLNILAFPQNSTKSLFKCQGKV